jgi:hypothetical protein
MLGGQAHAKLRWQAIMGVFSTSILSGTKNVY